MKDGTEWSTCPDGICTSPDGTETGRRKQVSGIVQWHCPEFQKEGPDKESWDSGKGAVI